MKKPEGWLELIGKTFAALLGFAKAGQAAGAGGSAGGAGGWQKTALPVILILLVAAVAYFYFFRAPTQGSVTCDLYPRYYKTAEWFGLGAKPVKPSLTEEGLLRVEGSCSFLNPGKEDVSSIIALVKISVGGNAIAQNTSNVALLSPTGKTPSLQAFEIVWPGSAKQKYIFSYCRLEDCKG